MTTFAKWEERFIPDYHPILAHLTSHTTDLASHFFYSNLSFYIYNRLKVTLGGILGLYYSYFKSVPTWCLREVPLYSDPVESLKIWKAHPCNFPGCNKVFTKSSNLKRHKRSHMGEKPYECTWEGCSRKFAQSVHLTRHYRVHTGSKPFKCHLCKKRFSQKNVRSLHITKLHRI